MKLLISTLLVLAPLSFATPVFAVDNSISALCRAGAPEAYSRPGGFCEAVANNKSMVTKSGSAGKCPANTVSSHEPPGCFPI